ncbi:hypothetical protein [Candidatus Tisiphia endosymbiont of Nemotelus uliginosus]|uniref:hypothetical protein n=1 Tax=Candidatus Tisiphia endosymbiont of Nemotelus uliginosus TaxID=3077926 RepID=UPI0035C8A224
MSKDKMSKDLKKQPMNRDMWAQYSSSTLSTGEGLVGVMGPGAHPDGFPFISGSGIKVLNQGSGVKTVNIDLDNVDIRYLGTWYTNHNVVNVQVMISPVVKTLSIGSMCDMLWKSSWVPKMSTEIYIDGDSKEKLTLTFTGTGSKTVPAPYGAGDVFPENNYKNLTKIIDPAKRCEVVVKPCNGGTIVLDYEYNGQPVHTSVTGEAQVLDFVA